MNQYFCILVPCLSAIVVFVTAVHVHNDNNRTARSAIGCSESVPTAEVVSSCPRTSEEWRTRSIKKNCSQFAHTCSSFAYHCVINTWMNETIEVCASKIYIIGKVCAEFNFGGELIQRHLKAQCKECPPKFESVKSFLYQECYQYVEKYRGSQIPTTSQVTTYFPESSYPFKTSEIIDTSPSSEKPQENDRVDTESEASMVVVLSSTAGVLFVFLLITTILVYRCLIHKKDMIPKYKDRSPNTGNSYVASSEKLLKAEKEKDFRSGHV